MSDGASRRARRSSRTVLVGAVLGILVTLGAGGLRAAGAAVPAAEMPEFRAPVVDQAGVLSDTTKRTVSAALEDYRRRSGRQVAVAVVRTTGDRSLEDYSIDLARKWGVGREGEDDGVLLLVAVRDRRVRIEVGRGVEGELTDVESGRIIRNRLVPLLAAGRYDEAVQQGTDAIRAALGDRAVGRLPPEPRAEPATTGPGAIALVLPFLFLGLLLLSLLGRRRRRRRWSGLGAPIVWGGFGGFGGGLGGFGGGGLGGGGFGGGGGGGFGGGGASGSW